MINKLSIKEKKNILTAAPYTIWMIGFIVIPLFFIIGYGITDKTGAFSIKYILEFFTPVHMKSFLISIKLALISTLICILLSYPLALILRDSGISKKSFLVYVFILPMWMNSLLRIIAWLNLLERSGLINTFLKFINLPTINIINTEAAIILGMVYDFLPFMILPIYNSVMKIDDNTVNAAYDLGATKRMTFWKIIFPLTIPGMVSGITMVFIPSLTTITISYILGGGKILLIGNVIEEAFLFSGNWNLGSSMSLVLIAFILITMALTSKYYDNEEGAVL